LKLRQNLKSDNFCRTCKSEEGGGALMILWNRINELSSKVKVSFSFSFRRKKRDYCVFFLQSSRSFLVKLFSSEKNRSLFPVNPFSKETLARKNGFQVRSFLNQSDQIGQFRDSL